MMPNTVLLTLMPTLMALPFEKHLEARCAETVKKIEKRGKRVPAKRAAKVFDQIVCDEARNLGKNLTTDMTKLTEKAIKEKKKEVEAEMKKKDPGTAQALKLTGFRDEIEKAEKETKVEPGKPMKLPKPKGSVLYRQKNVTVLTKDNVEVDVTFFLGIDPQATYKEGKFQGSYGVGIEVRF
jgi:hypothetical protein